MIIFGYLVYVIVGYYASRWSIDKLDEPMPFLLFILCILFVWPGLYFFTVSECFDEIKPRRK
jgi:hypothetical protein